MKPLQIFWRALPALTVFVIYLTLGHPFIDAAANQMTAALPYYLCVALLFISLTFNRSRLALASVNICMAYAFIQNGLQTSLSSADTRMLYAATSMLFCLHLLMISFYRERGSLSLWGVLRLVFVIGSYIPFWWLYKSGYAATIILKLETIFSPNFNEFWLNPIDSARRWVTPFWLAYFSLTGAGLVGMAIWKRSSIEFALIVAWLTGFLVFYDFAEPKISLLMFSILMIALFVAFIQITYDLAFVDSLTDLPGRRALLEKLGTLPRQYAIAMVDVDHFKKFNDTHGHDVGDQVLKLVASHLKQVRGGGGAYRYGGEEFTLVFPNRSLSQVEPHVEVLRKAIADYTIVIRDKERDKNRKLGEQLRGINRKPLKNVHVTVSIGVAEKSESAETADEVMKRADQALYKAKESGRNRVAMS